jgi:hypothetical protein
VPDREDPAQPSGSEPEHVVPLRLGPAPAAPPPARPVRLHGLAILAMAGFAVLGIGATLAFITVSWPGRTGRYLTATIVLSAVGFLASASAAVLSAARDTYARGDARRR